MTARRRRYVGTDAGLLALAIIWGVNFSVVKVVLRELEPFALNALRFPLAAIALAALLRAEGTDLLPPREVLTRILVLGVLGNVVYQLCFIVGIDWTGAGNASLLLATTPVWTVILSTLAGHERLTAWVSTGVTMTVVGIALIVFGRGDDLTWGAASVRGDLLMIVAAVLWSIYTVSARTLIGRFGSLRVTTWTIWSGTPFLVLIGVPQLAATPWTRVSVGAWLGVAYAGLLSVGLAYLLWYRGVQVLGNSRTAVYSNLVPVAALVTAWIWLGEMPARLQLLGSAVILVGLTAARLGQSTIPEPVDEDP